MMDMLHTKKEELVPYIIRCQFNRRLDQCNDKLYELIDQQPVAKRFTLRLPHPHTRKKRKVKLEMCFCTARVELGSRLKCDAHLTPIDVNIVEVKEVNPPPVNDQVAWGEYLSDDLLNCAKCHSASFQTNDDINPSNSVGYYGGGNAIETRDGEVVYSANLTPHPEHGLGEWTLEEFGQAIRYGQSQDGRPLNHLMPPFTALTDEEVAAIWAFLQTVPVIDNDPQAAGLD